MIVEITENPISKVEVVNILDYSEKVKVVYHNAEEELINFLNHCKLKGYEVMLWPRCSVVFDKEATEDEKGIGPHPSKKNFKGQRSPQFSFDKRRVSYQKH